MPRIRAATLAEHRAARLRALLDAGRAVIAETGRPPTLAAVAARAGLARPSVYEYFSSPTDLLTALVEDITPRWSQRVRAAMAAADPADRVLAYARANLELVAEGEHAVIATLAGIAPEQVTSDRARTMHRQLLEPLTEALAAQGARPVELLTDLVDAAIRTASRHVEEGMDLEEAWAGLAGLLAPLSGRGPSPA